MRRYSSKLCLLTCIRDFELLCINTWFGSADGNFGLFSRAGHRHQLKQSGVKAMLGRLSIAVIVLVICAVSFLSTIKSTSRSFSQSEIKVDTLWGTATSGEWRPSSAPRTAWPPPLTETNGYLRVRCNGGLNQQRSAPLRGEGCFLLSGSPLGYENGAALIIGSRGASGRGSCAGFHALNKWSEELF
ncbi:O-fucosyltransferase family protein [Forsythia ovata]|uniref:O-fucosyltransferase family protein n=1 Tax=Forsythia ovata TaxID=205694 RepID=A0ABD1R6U6_9LAMI